MKKIFYINYLILIVNIIEINPVKAQSCVLTNNLNVSTGISTIGSNLTTNGQIDPYWQLTNVAPPSVNTVGGINIPNAYTIISGSSVGYSNWCQIPGTVSLNVIPNYIFGTNNINLTQPWKFRRKFSVTASGTITISGSYIGDDQSELHICDPSGTVLFTDNQAGWSIIKQFSKTLQVNQGCYFIELSLTNVGSGLMGFAMNANITSTSNILSNPSLQCCSASIISGQKWIDNNCNGKIDAGDAPGAGWVFNLLNGSTIIQTSVSDANGQFYFNNIPIGTYTIAEVIQSGYSPISPAGGTQTVSVSQNNSVILLNNFLNCKAPPCQCGQFDSLIYNNTTYTTNWPNLSLGQGLASGILTAFYHCNPSTEGCTTSYNWQVLANGTPLSPAIISTTNSFNLSLLNGLACGTYTIKVTPTCGTTACTPKTILVKFDCPPLPCPCVGMPPVITQSAVNVITQNNASNANPVSTITTNFTLTTSVPISEVRILIDEFRLTTTAGNENCMLCRNKPQTWANINSATLTGVTNQTIVNPSALEKDIRELVFNNGAGTAFNLNGNILSLTLGLPGVTGLDCCTLKADVCIKFIIRDVNCCEREIMKCFTFNLQ
ncbi:SdrD B-like domain-containing protein [Limnovirga soli]|nr:SdrD B-like domain-containing protein [Limnovirga soli]